jgi:hypothetical protein
MDQYQQYVEQQWDSRFRTFEDNVRVRPLKTRSENDRRRGHHRHSRRSGGGISPRNEKLKVDYIGFSTAK